MAGFAASYISGKSQGTTTGIKGLKMENWVLDTKSKLKEEA